MITITKLNSGVYQVHNDSVVLGWITRWHSRWYVDHSPTQTTFHRPLRTLREAAAFATSHWSTS